MADPKTAKVGTSMLYLSTISQLRLQEVSIHRATFPNPVQFYKVFEYFGANTLTTEGAEWQIHRKLVAKSFTEQNNKPVRKETVVAMLELLTLWETEGQEKGECVRACETFPNSPET